MIFDKIENIGRYGYDLQFILDDLQRRPFKAGKYNLDEPKHFVIGLEYMTQIADKCIWEAHRKYMDIHVILEGEEVINISDLSTMEAINEYQDDYQLFEGETQQRLQLSPGYFLLLFPNEVHRTAISIDKDLLVQKNVYKNLI